MDTEIKISKWEYERMLRTGMYTDYRNLYKRCKNCFKMLINTDRDFEVVRNELTDICKECYPTYYSIDNVKKRLEANRDKNLKLRQYRQAREGRKKRVVADLKYDEWIEALKYFDNSCAYCGAFSHDPHQDHVIPLVKGGGYTKQNIIPACIRCNESKNRKDMEEWYRSRECFTEQRLDKIKQWQSMN